MNRLYTKSTKLHGNRVGLKSLPFDLKIFEESKRECNDSPNDTPITERCSFTQRLCAATSYFDHIQKSTTLSDDDKKRLFVEFNEEIYHSVLDDVAHFIKEHDDDIQRVHDEWTQRYGVVKCSVSECPQTARHYGRERTDKNRKEEDATYSFYESLFDRIHYFIFHLFDVGMRVDTTSLNVNKGDDENENESEEVAAGKLFAAERDHINSRRKELNMDSQRMNSLNSELTMDSERRSPLNSKFTIQTVNEQQGMTLTDALLEELMKKMKMKREAVQQIQGYLDQNSFDSDAMEMDLEERNDSNLGDLVVNQSVVEGMVKFIQSIKLHRAAFPIGLQFKYNKDRNSNEMFVKPKYRNLKEEMMESGHVTRSDWMEFVDLKGRKYWKDSETVKKIREYGLKGGFSDFGLAKQHHLSLEHLFAIILFCDFTNLRTAFSRTFWRKNVFESLESVMSRHSDFCHFGRILSEMVNEFGISGSRYGGGNGAQKPESGPFFHGINRVLNIGSFAITLKGPCSTTTVMTVAMNFSNSDGMVLKLNNDTMRAESVRFFDCSWISNYGEEQERLWIGGDDHSPLRIVTILLIRSAKNYQKVVRALYLFDAMISGVNLYGLKMKEKMSDYDLISKLMDWTLNGGDIASSEMDPFLQNEWTLFLLRERKEFTLSLQDIDECYHSLSKLVVYKVERNDDAKGAHNVLRPEWISMFRSVDTLNISTGYGGDYKFRLQSLLDSIQSIPPSITINVIDYGHWIENELADDVAAVFNAAGWNIEYKKQGNEWEYKLVIKSKSLLF